MSDGEPDQDETGEDEAKTDERRERKQRRTDADQKADSTSNNGSSSAGASDRRDRMDSAGVTVDGKDENQFAVPQMTVDQAVRYDRADQMTAPPADDRLGQVPQIQPHSPPAVERTDMVETIPGESAAGSMAVPQITPVTTHSVTPIELDDDRVEGIERVQQVQIPQVTIEHRHHIKPLSTFIETGPEITAEPTAGAPASETDEYREDAERPRAETMQVTGDAADAFSESGPGHEWASGEWPDPLDLLFGSGGTELKRANPMVVLVDDDFLVGVVETLVKRRYREIEGGEPELWKFDTADQLADEERWLSADSRIFTAQLPEEEWETLESADYQEAWESIWRNRFDQLFSGQQFGAIIFNRRKIPGPEVTLLPDHPPTLVELERTVDWREIARAFWTNLDAVEPRRAQTFSQVFDAEGNGVAQDRLIQIQGVADGKFALATEDDDAASDEHYAMKVFVVEWVAEQVWGAGEEFTAYDDLLEIEDYREIERTIPTEQPLGVTDDDAVRPDVRYGPQVFEVEMFFEEADGSGVISKLKETVRKYEHSQITTVNIVVDNLTCLLHLKELAQFKRNHRAWEDDYAKINLYTVDLSRGELVPVSEVVDEITSLSVS